MYVIHPALFSVVGKFLILRLKDSTILSLEEAYYVLDVSSGGYSIIMLLNFVPVFGHILIELCKINHERL